MTKMGQKTTQHLNSPYVSRFDWMKTLFMYSLSIIFHHPWKLFFREHKQQKANQSRSCSLDMYLCSPARRSHWKTPGLVPGGDLCCTPDTLALKLWTLKPIISCVNDHSTTHSCSILSPWRRAYGLLWSSTISECRAMISSSRWLTSATCRTNQESITKRIAERHYRPEFLYI